MNNIAKMVSSAAKPKITLYVDTVSPFAYEAYYLLRHDPIFKNVEVTYIPIFLGGLMHKCGNTAPIKIKNKDIWINKERLRWATHFNIPMLSPGLPPDFPANTLPVMRALAAIQDDKEKLIKGLDVFFKKHWAEGVATHRPEVLKETLVELYGKEEAERILTAASSSAKPILLSNTDLAFSDGAFGLPWMVCTNSDGEKEGFWGVDHLGQVVQFLGLSSSNNAQGSKNKGWKAVL
ncbi:thioredoxin-like protein [Cladorrhinum samala]|uniref:Glutathione S-transferase kappa n=1 Tax=Cladorrhinum samala TaxID=585594 RepID=A0AAV9I027_9PEZI|nr:thioredoxin-like protein [Cladorrhinum samala]